MERSERGTRSPRIFAPSEGRGAIPLPAGCADAQQALLAAFQLITDEAVVLSPENVLKMDEAELLCCALNHQSMNATAEEMGIKLSDPYYTEEEWKKVLQSRLVLVGGAREVLEGNTTDQSIVADWLKREKTLPLCDCSVHRL